MEPAKRIFQLWEKRWEKVQFTKKGEHVHAARVSAKYSHLKCHNSDDSDRFRWIKDGVCAELCKIDENSTKKRRVRVLLHLHEIYEGFYENKPHQRQCTVLSQLWNRERSFFVMIKDYNIETPDPTITFVGKRRM